MVLWRINKDEKKRKFRTEHTEAQRRIKEKIRTKAQRRKVSQRKKAKFLWF